MQFKNHTPFPAMAWKSIDNKNHTFTPVIVRVKYLFDSVDDKGCWSLKLDPDQGELFGKDMYYNEEDIVNSSVRFESDYVTYKPHGDLIVNAYAHSTVPLKEWRCGVKVLRTTENEETPHHALIEKWLRVKGERYIQNDVVGFSFTQSQESIKVPIRYEYANGGSIPNPDFDPEAEVKKPFLRYAAYNTVGVGLVDKTMFKADIPLRAPQIESMTESLDKANMPNLPQGFGFIRRDWQPRIKLAGTFDDNWIKTKAPLMPDDYKEAHNNAAHPDLQLKGYFEPFDKIVLYNLVKDRYEQSFDIPNFYFKAVTQEVFTSDPYFLHIDTVIVDILEDKMQDNAVYVSYRTRIPSSSEHMTTILNMHVPKDFIGESHG